MHFVLYSPLICTKKYCSNKENKKIIRKFLHCHLLGNYTPSVRYYWKVLKYHLYLFVGWKVMLAIATEIPFFYIHDNGIKLYLQLYTYDKSSSMASQTLHIHLVFRSSQGHLKKTSDT